MKRSAWMLVVVLALVSQAGAQTSSPGCGLVFDGNSRLVIPSQPALQNASEFTVEAWVAPSAAGSPVNTILLQKSGSYELSLGSGGGYKFTAWLNPGNTPVAVTSSLTVNYWNGAFHHVAASFNSYPGGLRLFIDGNLVSSVTTGLTGKTLVQSATSLEIGGVVPIPGTSGFPGGLDEVRLWSRMRVASEIATDSRVPLRHVPYLEVALAGDGAQGAAVPATFPDQSGHHQLTTTGAVTYGAGIVCAAAHPGTGADFTLRTGLNGAEVDSVGDKTVSDGWSITFEFLSHAGTFDGAPIYWVGQLYPGGVNPVQYPGLEEVQIDLFLPYFSLLEYFPLPQGGLTLTGNAPALSNLDFWTQVAVFSPATATGWATTDAHVLRFRPAIYVNGSAPAGGNGTAAAPYDSLPAALATAQAGSTIYLATGTYASTPILGVAANLRGGYDPVTWTPTSTRSIIQPSQRGMRFENITVPTTVSGLEIRSGNGVPVGTGSFADRPSFAVAVRDCTTALRFENCLFGAGNGAAGSNGFDIPGPATNGTNGGNGENGHNPLDFPVVQSLGGTAYANAGAGGQGGYFECTGVGVFGGCTTFVRHDGVAGSGAMSPACSLVAGGTAANSAGISGTAPNGNPGSNGASSSTNGAGGTTNTPGGFVNASGVWTPNDATAGATGGNGCPGSGGGGGGGVGSGFLSYASGGGGGAGGSGGFGGQGGGGGREGAPSVAAWLQDASPTFTTCTFLAGAGGAGGRGGNGGVKGLGGLGGIGGAGATYNVLTGGGPIQGGQGGAGGNGGNGGQGGGGGGASGGASWSVVKAGSSAPPALTAAASANTLIPGTAGAGGAAGLAPSGGSNGQAGVAGAVANTKVFP